MESSSGELVVRMGRRWVRSVFRGGGGGGGGFLAGLFILSPEGGGVVIGAYNFARVLLLMMMD